MSLSRSTFHPLFFVSFGCAIACSSSHDDDSSNAEGSGGSSASGGSSSDGGASGGLPGVGGASSGGTNSGDTSSGGSPAAGGDGSGGGTTELSFLSPAWDVLNNEDCSAESPEACPLYPQENTNFGDNVSPEMTFEGAPEGTQSFAIVLYDMVNGFTHWVMWDIPASTMTLPASLPGGSPLAEPAGAKQAGFGNPPGYFGSGACGNVYEHRLYALSVPTLPGNLVSAGDVRSEIESSSDVLGEVFVRMQSRQYCTP